MIKAIKWVAGKVLRVIPEPLLGRLLPGEFRFDPRDPPELPEPPIGAIRVYIAPANYAGQGWEWARAIDRYFDGAQASNMVYQRKADFRYQADGAVPLGFYAASRRWQRRQFDWVVKNFTHVIIEAEQQPFGAVLDESVTSQVRRLQTRGLTVTMLCHGTDIRLPSRHRELVPNSPFADSLASVAPKLEELARTNRQILDSLALPVLVSTPDLLADVPVARWLPVVVDAARWSVTSEPLDRAVPVVAHAPSKGAVKGSELIDPILQRMHERGIIEYRRVNGVPSAQMPDVYRSADIVLDQFRLGSYGVAACEAMAAGRVVVGHITDDNRARVRESTGESLPIVESTVEDLEEVLLGVILNREGSREIARAGAAFVAKVHDGRFSAAVFEDLFHS